MSRLKKATVTTGAKTGINYKVIAVIKKVYVNNVNIINVPSTSGVGTYKAIQCVDDNGVVTNVPVLGRQEIRKGAYYLVRKQADVEEAKSFLTLDYVTEENTNIMQQALGTKYKQMIANGIPESVALKEVFGL
jgi:hypothetical protein